MSAITREQEQGGASIFVVIFSALLITVITVGFVQLMLRSQQDALTLDLSQSAYDSALAGVEDAKIAIDIAQNNTAAAAILANQQCGSVKQVLMDITDGRETIIQQNTEDESLAQAYTCVKVDMNPGQTDGDLVKNESEVIPLRVASSTPVTHMKVTWRLPNEVQGPATYPMDTNNTLPHSDEWGEKRPALLRLQLIQYSGAVSASSFTDDSTAINRTMFFQPDSIVSGNSYEFSEANDATMKQVLCDTSGSCSITLALPSSGTTRFARLTSLYNGMHYSLSLHGSEDGPRLPLEDVTAKVDSTGRAGDVYRRVEADVDLRRQSTYPEAALDVNDPICKDFTVGTREEHYSIRCDAPVATP